MAKKRSKAKAKPRSARSTGAGPSAIVPRVTPARPVPPRPLPRPAPAPTPNAPAARARAERLLADARKLMAAATSAFYRLGLVLRELSRKERYAGELGFDSFEELLDAHDLGTRIHAYRLIQIVDAFDQKTAEKLGSKKSEAVVRYAYAVHPGMPPIEVWRRDPVIDVGGETMHLSTASARAVEEAIKQHGRVDVPRAYVRAVQSATRGIGQCLDHDDIETARVRTVHRGARLVVRIEVDGTEATKLLALFKRG